MQATEAGIIHKDTRADSRRLASLNGQALHDSVATTHRFYAKLIFSVIGTQRFKPGRALRADRVPWRSLAIGSGATLDIAVPERRCRP